MENKTTNQQNPSAQPTPTPLPAQPPQPQTVPKVDDQAVSQTVVEPLGPTNLKTIVPGEKEDEGKDSIKGVIATIAIFLLAPIVAIFLTAFVFQSYEVDGPSMETTLQNQDRLVVFKLPKTWSNIFGGEYIPNRGEIVIFTRDEGFGNTRQLIKRVIGIPGDHVVVKNGEVTVFNDENPGGYNPDEGQSYHQTAGTEGNVDVTIADDEIFVMGDNRSNSLDSRIFGPIKQDDITGKLLLRIYPLNKFDSY